MISAHAALYSATSGSHSLQIPHFEAPNSGCALAIRCARGVVSPDLGIDQTLPRYQVSSVFGPFLIEPQHHNMGKDLEAPNDTRRAMACRRCHATCAGSAKGIFR
jgi:hypothetical protein